MSTVSQPGSESDYRPGRSSEAAPDAMLLEQTKQQIRSLVAEIAELAKADVAPQQFYTQFLDRVVSALAAVGGAVWTRDDEGRLSLQYQINLQETRLLESEAAQRRHARLLGHVLQTETPVLAPPQSGGSGDDEPANPTDFLLVLALLKTDLETVGIVEVFQRNEGGPNTQRGYLRFLTQMCELAGDFLKSHQLRHFSHRQVLWTQLEEFCRVVHASLDPRETAYTIANEGRRLIECDRLSVALQRGNNCTIEAISGQDVFDRRANAVRLLEKLAAAVTSAGDPVWYTGDTTDLPPQVEEAVQAYVDESHSKTVGILPLMRRRPETEEQAAKREPPEPPLGALIVEQIEDSRVPASLLQRSEVVTRHSVTALANAHDHDAVFLMPLWRAIGRNRWIVAARNLPLTLSIGGGVLLVLLILCLWPAQFRPEAKGALQPVVRRNVYAGAKGRVYEIKVQHGEQVRAGQLLVVLRDTELEMAITENEGQRITTGKHVVSLGRLLLESKNLSVEERSRINGEQLEAEEKLITLAAQRNLLEQKRREMEITSPIDGQVITWDLENRLKNLPVQRGQMLLTVADASQPWQLELRMPEGRMGHVAAARKRLLDTPEAKRRTSDLAVDFQLASAPGETFDGLISDVQLAAEVHGEEGNTVLIKVAVDKDKLPHLRPGTTATGRVFCGYRPLGYVWFHDVWAFVQTRVLFRYF